MNSGKIISGTALAKSILERLKRQVVEIRQDKCPSFRPNLVIVQVGDRADSNVYVKAKIKAAHEAGVNAQHLRLARYSNRNQVCYTIARLTTVYFLQRSPASFQYYLSASSTVKLSRSY